MHKGGKKIWLTPRVQHREQTKSTHACEVHSTMLSFESQNTKKKKKNPLAKVTVYILLLDTFWAN